MSRVFKLFCWVGLGIFLQSCHTINTVYQTKKLFYGQNRNEVVKIFGSPTEKKIVDKNREIYVYYIHSNIFDLFLNIERFPYLGFYPLNTTGKEFWILLNNNILVSSGYVKEMKEFLKMKNLE